VYATIALGPLLPPVEAVQRLETAASLTDWPLISAWQTLWWLRAGNTSMATYWLEESRAHPAWLSAFERWVQARVLVALERWDEAEHLLDALQADAIATKRFGDLIRILLLQAHRYQVQGQSDAALRSLAQSLEQGERGGYFRTFLDAGEVVAGLLRHLAAHQSSNRYLTRMIHHLPDRPASVALPFGGTLGQQELAVLRLIAAGASNETIAGTLFLTVGTVKWYVHQILAKLGATNRAHAVTRAQELGVISLSFDR